MRKIGDTVTLLRFINAHSHLREGEDLAKTVRAEKHYSFVVAMGNLTKPTSTAAMAFQYLLEIYSHHPKFKTIPTLIMTKDTTVQTISFAAQREIKAVKFLPGDTSTNSGRGMSFYDLLSSSGRKLLEEIAKNSLLLLVHAELARDKNGFPIANRSRSFRALCFLEKIVRDFPDLKLVVEHANDRETLNFVRSANGNVWATLRPQDTILTYDDVCDRQGKIINPLNFARPIAKSEDDRRAVLEAMTSGEDKFFFGTDCAPHSSTAKLKEGAAGIFLPGFVAVPMTVGIFEQAEALHKIKKFTVDIARAIYGLPEITETITLKRQSWVVPSRYHGYPVFLGGKKLDWKLMSLK